MDDLAGRLLAQKDEWRVLQLPALAERDDPLGREPGEALWPGWEDAAALQRKRDAIGERAWSALYQQCPFERTGHLFRVDRITVLDGHQEDARYVRAWDLAASAAGGGRDPDWTVGLKLGRTGAGRYVIADIVRLRATPYDIEQEIRATAERDGGSVQIGLPQDPGQAGKLQVAWLAGRLSGYRVSASPESGAKHIRALPVAAQIEAGNMGMVRAGWNRALLDELAEFPDGAKDDQVDALTRAFSMLVDTAPAARNTRVPLIAR